ncbi:uncharacterized protein C8A04DRAFT_38065 [Dichotomopilus funicola]|uniref:Uncharacterized protein n=1 Tax=Dichotomopilus funicola TaxID=1934379 RepID=A0AAN6V1H1_9PEZI|nr:hypothetical protein C8A04DRAFT_38065 [Dichotomopilus funicola]
MSSSGPPKPIFGIEIEIFVKVKRDVERDVQAHRSRGSSLPTHWQEWSFSLTNDRPNSSDTFNRQARQRACVKLALTSLINDALGRNHGWKWGIEIISPPMSIAKRWQSEIREVFDAIGEQFELWTHPVTSCHVHVSPGPTSKTKYKASQMVRIAKGAFYWEDALRSLLPHDRRRNDYAKANHKAFATSLYNNVERNGWKPVFNAIENEMDRFENHRQGQLKCFAIKIAGGHLSHPNAKYRKERYLSMNFLPYTRIGTIEFRRQGGVASAQSAIHRVLLAVSLHISARKFDFNAVANKKSYPKTEDLIQELKAVIASMPKTCHGTKFVGYLRECVEMYGHREPMSERAVNARERRLHDTSGSSVMSVPSTGPGRVSTGMGSGNTPRRTGPPPARGGGRGGRGGGGGGGRGGGGGGGGSDVVLRSKNVEVRVN